MSSLWIVQRLLEQQPAVPTAPQAMESATLRRSRRLHIYDSNGRDFLADSMGWSRSELEQWLTSPDVRPHLQLWYKLCVATPAHFNESIEWINTGENGYYYRKDDGLEDDLLLMCMDEGLGDKAAEPQRRSPENAGGSTYADEHADTREWITQELWARTAWRIVAANRGPGEAFEVPARRHSAACFGFAIDLLCVAFHSLAFRGTDSVYEGLICGGRLGGWGSRRVDLPKESKDEVVDEQAENGIVEEESETETEMSEGSTAGEDTENGILTSPATSLDEADIGEEIVVKMRLP
ncbi:hypothetical protein BDY17DRAFT_293940 [Neohortaea acidophila]|uniref:Uncharacterized protein n=1 Tax=Neohortaea acidophila TaxID=245834 RepID=A0A6A6PZZ0_9PEZI|nr:uncharacterized protein BDY17DRAFT_293940 [Neohortaea acidophila]KAF2485595.1 hypothetical protein BDY17DRAFT_293940 [Neohortaea acidophila]